MHLALMALPIRALFIPIGFQSIVCDPNVMFAAIEEAKKVEDKEKIVKETEDFFYFNESSRKKYDQHIDEGEVTSHLNDEGKKETEDFLTDKIKDTIKMGEESMASEFLGISDTSLKRDVNDEGKVSIVPVAFDLNLRSIVTKGLFGF